VAQQHDTRRRAERYPFVATAYITDERTGVGMTTRLRDLSLHGCYIHMVVPLAVGTKVTLQIGAGTSVFRAMGTVIHSHANQGFGIEFDREQLDPASLTVLDAWLTEARALHSSDGIV